MNNERLKIKDSVNLDEIKERYGMVYQEYGHTQYLMTKASSFAGALKIDVEKRLILVLQANYNQMIMLYDLINDGYVEKYKITDNEKIDRKIASLEKQIEKLRLKKE